MEIKCKSKRVKICSVILEVPSVPSEIDHLLDETFAIGSLLYINVLFTSYLSKNNTSLKWSLVIDLYCTLALHLTLQSK